ncbi:hypothetical protein A3Q56_07756, partial [Intoshia linei]
MYRGKKRPTLNLSNTNTNVRRDAAERVVDSKEESTELDPVTNLLKRLKDLDIDESQKQSLVNFMTDKKKLGILSLKDFSRIHEIGSGNGGVVFKVEHKPTKLITAIKTILLDVKPSVRKNIFRELSVLHECNSPHIVGWYGAIYNSGQINIIMEYMDCGSLDLVLKKCGRYPESIISIICLAVLRGLQYLREKHKIMHRDVKPSNVLLNSCGEIKLCDFGVSAQLIDSKANSFVGTRSYMSPERLQGSNYSVHSDIWSLGISIVELALGIFPIPFPSDIKYPKFFAENHYNQQYTAAEQGLPLKPVVDTSTTRENMAIFELLECIVNEPPPSLNQNYFTNEFVKFTEMCLTKEPSERATINALLEHEFPNNSVNNPINMKNW